MNHFAIYCVDSIFVIILKCLVRHLVCRHRVLHDWVLIVASLPQFECVGISSYDQMLYPLPLSVTAHPVDIGHVEGCQSAVVHQDHIAPICYIPLSSSAWLSLPC